jgi:hypothetical protein
MKECVLVKLCDERAEGGTVSLLVRRSMKPEMVAEVLSQVMEASDEADLVVLGRFLKYLDSRTNNAVRAAVQWLVMNEPGNPN